ncbi:carbohydrate kinase family protein [Mordavella massiliensis]|uniref:Carbohydrate kinase family protein n=1 Tax=Mordavella massiliensis TaxID=1871024 RepID=A0A938XCV4_9CLOT|nr:carbohydrate kinase family protein [Mordavella massiliensis]MBM6948379.1 carbohydrate kinase family protein [Mordavella massiliensis]
MAGKIIVAGHICLDITPVFSSETAQPLSSVLIPGKLVQMRDVNISTGGAVANTGLGLKVLGADVELMGKVGDDEFGQIVLDRLKRYGAAEGMIVSKDSSTSYSIVIAPPGTDRIFLHNPGANDTFRAADLDFDRIAGASHFHFGYPPIMRHMYEAEGAQLEEIFRRVKGLGLTTSLDMAAVDPDSDAGRADWEKILRRVLPCVDYFVPSVEELCFMADRPRYEAWMTRAAGADVTSVIGVEADIRPLAQKVLAMGARSLLIKCGAPGMYYTDGSREIFERSYKPAKVLSGTGAGDTSIAAFLKAQLDGCSIEESLHLAAATGASCVEAYDALGGLRSFEELRQMIKEGWEKQ